jgi:phage baseplate assembly protein gpV
VHLRQSFDDYNETCEMIDGSAAIYPHHLGFLMVRGISSITMFGQAKQCVTINAFDTKYLRLAYDVIANLLHLAHNIETELPCTDLPILDVTAC